MTDAAELLNEKLVGMGFAVDGDAQYLIAALREACGGGDIVIRQDGSLATLLEGLGIDFCTAHHGVRNEDERECEFARVDAAECVLSEAFIVVPGETP